MRTLAHWIFALALAGIAGCASVGSPRPSPPLTDEVVKMSQAGKPAEEIIKLMQDSRAVYKLTGSQLGELRQQGVPDKVIDYMLETQLDAVRREEALYRPLPPPWWYYGPHPYYYHRYRHHHPYWWW